MGQLDWEENLDLVVDSAIISGHFKGGLRKPVTLQKVQERLAEKWEDALLISEIQEFNLVLLDKDGKRVEGRHESVRSTSLSDAEEIAENLLGPIDIVGSTWIVHTGGGY